MTKAARFRRLLSIGSHALAPAFETSGELLDGRLRCSVGDELLGLLSIRNGFYAFESALLIRPLYSESDPLGLVQWNRADLWKSEYKSKLGDVVCFAEDIFGVQFCIEG